VDMYRKVRLACAEGMSQREAARHFGVSRDSVRKMLAFSVPPGYRRTAPVKRPKLDGFTGIIDGWLEGDRGVHRKQRHTAKRVFERLREEHGFTGGYTTPTATGATIPPPGSIAWSACSSATGFRPACSPPA
jgi:transposase